MIPKILIIAFLLNTHSILNVASLGNAIFGPHFSLPFWCYDDSDCDESTWVEECRAGHQSPIDLPPLKSVTGHHETVHDFPRSSLQFPNFELDYRGLTIQVKPGGDPFYFTRRISATENIKYRLLAMDFHWGDKEDIGAEHSIDGLYYEAEVHLLFYDETVFNAQTANAIPQYTGDNKDFLVIAIFLDEEHLGWMPTSHFLDPISKRLKDVTGYDPITVDQPLNLTGMFRGKIAYKYQGSFTSPICRGVEWMVFRKPVIIPKWHMKAFRNAKIEGDKISNNYRRGKGKDVSDISLVRFLYV